MNNFINCPSPVRGRDPSPRTHRNPNLRGASDNNLRQDGYSVLLRSTIALLQIKIPNYQS